MKLVDLNVWLAIVWGRHEHHDIAKKWFDAEEDDLIFCRVTQLGLLRLVTNAAVTGSDALLRRRAWDLYAELIADPRIRFLAEPHGLEVFWVAFSKRDDRSHLLWTDDYLAAFAQASEAEIITFDKAFSRRYASVHVTRLS